MIRISSSFNPLKIFISSSWTDDTIKEECHKIEKEYIPILHLKPIIGNSGSDDPTRLNSIKKVRKSDIILIILGVKYSDIVVDEYNEAKAYDIPILVFVKDRLEMEDSLLHFFEKIKREKSYKRFEDLEDLKVELIENIMDLISDRFRQYQEIYKAFLGLLDNYAFKIPKRLLDKLNKLNE